MFRALAARRVDISNGGRAEATSGDRAAAKLPLEFAEQTPAVPAEQHVSASLRWCQSSFFASTHAPRGRKTGTATRWLSRLSGK